MREPIQDIFQDICQDICPPEQRGKAGFKDTSLQQAQVSKRFDLGGVSK
jgi:hypothetical protein